jgi:hypothetical protein
MKEMFEASVDGEPFDMDRWGQYFKPAGMGQATGDPNTAPKSVPAPRAAPAVTAALAAEPAPWEDEVASAEKTFAPKQEAAAPAATGGRADDILAMIRNRNKQ